MPLQKFITKFRKFRTEKLDPFGKFLLKIKISANLMTLISLILGLISVYFLFQNHLYFIIFGVLHLIADGLDGVIARVSQPTKFGQYFDFSTDRLIEYLIIIKLYFFLNDYYVLIILTLLIISHITYLFSKMQYPTYFARTGAIVLLPFYPLLPHLYLILGYLLIGILSVHALLLQLKQFLRTRKI